ncbi:MAG: dicarboxylate/amino acid:cation symporter [Tenericutes bacterium]|nr:dicarboxylate/amino acid:cation symporter [Mycoplasmatota bacterium]
MKKIWKNYKSTIILLLSIIIGTIIGLIFKEKACILSPLGDIFLNLMFVVIVPLIFLTITSSIIKMENPKRLGKIMITILIVFAVMSIIAALIGVVSSYTIKLIDSKDINNLTNLLNQDVVISEEVNILQKTANLLTVNDFYKILSKENIIAILVFSIIFGFAIRKSKDKGKKVIELILSLNEVVINIVNIIMYYAPIGLGCFIATLIGSYGSVIAIGFLKTFIVYTLVCIFIYVFVYSAYVFLVSGKKGLKAYWKNIIGPSTTALATCSSAATIPINIKYTKEMGVPSDIAETTIPMGTSFHKDGSVVGSAFKIMFLIYLFGKDINILTILGVSLLSTLLITAVPIGGGTISEMFILQILGFPSSALPIISIIATIIDAPATVLNVVGDSCSSLIVARIIDGKNFLKLNRK